MAFEKRPVRDEMIRFLVTPEEREIIQAAAEQDGITVSEYIRATLQRAMAHTAKSERRPKSNR